MADFHFKYGSQALLVRSSTLALHRVLPLGLSLYTKRPEAVTTACCQSRHVRLRVYWKDSFIGSAAELERKTSAPYQLGFSEFRVRLHQRQDLIAFQNRLLASLDIFVFVGMSADCFDFYNLTIQFSLIPSRAREYKRIVCLPYLTDTKLALM